MKILNTDGLNRGVWIWVKTMYWRITLNKITTAFFIISFLHCFIHSIVQSFLYTIDESANTLADDIVSVAHVPEGHFAWLTRSDGGKRFVLRLCDAVPMDKSFTPCVTIFDNGGAKLEVPAGFKRSPQDAPTLPSGSSAGSTPATPSDINTASASQPVRQVFANMGGDFFLLPVLDQTGNVTGVDFAFRDAERARFLDTTCTRVLVYAKQVLENAKREELALLASEFWLFGISVFAIMYDSIPHLLAGLFMRVLSTGWSAYSIWRTQDIELRFSTLITNGACRTDLFPTYFKQRMSFQIPDLVLNLLALVLSSFMVYRLVNSYAKQMFARVGAPAEVIRVYRFFLGVFVCMQLLSFLLVTSAGLWIDQLINGAIARISSFTPIYRGLFIITMILLLPWITMGWFATRREMKRTMAAFLGIGFVFLACWAIMYYSLVFRWTWLQWPFFASLTVASQLVLVASIVLGVYSWKNFNKGLAQFFRVDAALTRNDFEPEIFRHDTASVSASSLSDADIEKKGQEYSYRLSLNMPSQAPKVYVVPSLGKNDPWGKGSAPGAPNNDSSGDLSAYEHDDDHDKLRNVAL